MKTSIVVPCYGGYGVYLDGCLESLQAQTISAEIIVVTDGKTAGVNEVCEKYAKKANIIKIIENSSSQPVLINRGFSHATGEFFLDMGVDDFLYPDYIETAEEFLTAHPDYAIYVPQYMTFGNSEDLWAAEGLALQITERNTMLMGSIIRADLWHKLQGFDEQIPYDVLYDWEFWIRAWRAGAIAYLGEKPLYKYRVQAGATHDLFSAHGTEFLNYAREKGVL